MVCGWPIILPDYHWLILAEIDLHGDGYEAGMRKFVRNLSSNVGEIFTNSQPCYEVAPAVCVNGDRSSQRVMANFVPSPTESTPLSRSPKNHRSHKRVNSDNGPILSWTELHAFVTARGRLSVNSRL